MKTEPAVVIGAVQAFVFAIVALIVGFGVDWTQAQVGLVLGVIGSFFAIITALFVRSKVTPT